MPDLELSGLSNTERIIPIGRSFVNPDTGSALVEFSQVTNVTAVLLRTGGA